MDGIEYMIAFSGAREADMEYGVARAIFAVSLGDFHSPNS